jgi:hypothetical protein
MDCGGSGARRRFGPGRRAVSGGAARVRPPKAVSPLRSATALHKATVGRAALSHVRPQFYSKRCSRAADREPDWPQGTGPSWTAAEAERAAALAPAGGRLAEVPRGVRPPKAVSPLRSATALHKATVGRPRSPTFGHSFIQNAVVAQPIENRTGRRVRGRHGLRRKRSAPPLWPRPEGGWRRFHAGSGRRKRCRRSALPPRSMTPRAATEFPELCRPGFPA